MTSYNFEDCMYDVVKPTDSTGFLLNQVSNKTCDVDVLYKMSIIITICSIITLCHNPFHLNELQRTAHAAE